MYMVYMYTYSLKRVVIPCAIYLNLLEKYMHRAQPEVHAKDSPTICGVFRVGSLLFDVVLSVISTTVNPVLSGHLKRRPTLGFKTDYLLMQVKSIAECSNGSILQYFPPSLNYHLSLRSLFYLFMSGA